MKSTGTGSLVYVGTYTRGRSEGIYVGRLNPETGRLVLTGKSTGVSNPSYLALGPGGRFLYAVCEVMEYEGRRSGAVRAYAIDRVSGDLTLLNEQPTLGPGPCYVSIERTGRLALVANYAGGSIAALPIEADGRLGPASDFHQHQGKSVDPRRQETAHAHCIVPDPANQRVLVADLGLDRIMVYRLDLAEGKLRPNEKPWAQVKPGAGPRHIALHPNGRYAYLINELDSTLTAFAYDAARGTLSELGTVATLPEGYEGTSHCADVHVSATGRFVYGSNRGHDSIAVFAVDEATGRLSLVEHVSTQGKTPRNFAIDPSGHFLLAANQNSDSIVTFRIDPETGRLTPSGEVADVPNPVCIKFL